MTLAYLDCFSGVSGDMLLGALIDAGAPLEKLKQELAALHLDGFDLIVNKVVRHGITATDVTVHIYEETHEEPHHGHDHAHAQGHEHHHDHGAQESGNSHGASRDHHHSAQEHPHFGEHDHHQSTAGQEPDPPPNRGLHNHPHRGLNEIAEILENAALSGSVKKRAMQVFRRLAEAEGKIHGKPAEEIHFHEVGALDTIVDVVGTIIGLELLGITHLYCSPLHVGSGFVKCAHGTLPVPAPATLELLKSVPTYSRGLSGEMVTPTGAALVTTLASGFGPLPPMKVVSVGYGAGKRQRDEIPNLLRLVVGHEQKDEKASTPAETDAKTVIECNIDDMNPELYGHVLEGLLQQGALDAYLTPVYMKKSRPGNVLTVVCKASQVERLSRFILQETTTLGVRYYPVQRFEAERRMVKVPTPYGDITVKVGLLDGRPVNVAPEYSDCHQAALQGKVPLKLVYDTAKAAALQAGAHQGET